MCLRAPDAGHALRLFPRGRSLPGSGGTEECKCGIPLRPPFREDGIEADSRTRIL